MRTLSASDRQTLLLYAILTGLILFTWLAGSYGIALMRPLFLVASIALGYVTWRSEKHCCDDWKRFKVHPAKTVAAG
jgi:hypothetical protein